MTGRVSARLLLLVLAFAAGCGGGPLASHTSPSISSPARSSAATTPSPSATLAPTRPPTPAATATAVPLLRDGPLNPGTYLYVPYSCHPPRDCSEEGAPQGAPGIEVTVPSSRWEAETEFLAIWPRTGQSQTAALVMGWTNVDVGLNSEPCSQVSHQPTDIEVGPSVDDFVDAVVANPNVDITEPTDVRLGGFTGRFFTLTTPADQSGCYEWRPWDPGFYAQAPSSIWDVWVIDVDGFRILIVADYLSRDTGRHQVGATRDGRLDALRARRVLVRECLRASLGQLACLRRRVVRRQPRVRIVSVELRRPSSDVQRMEGVDHHRQLLGRLLADPSLDRAPTRAGSVGRRLRSALAQPALHIFQTKRSSVNQRGLGRDQ